MQETQEMWVWFLGQEDPLEKEMTTHSSILAGKIPWTEEPGGWQSIGWQRVRHDWARTGLVAPWHVGSSWIRDGTCVSCTGRWILYNWVTGEDSTYKWYNTLLRKPNQIFNLTFYLLTVNAITFTFKEAQTQGPWLYRPDAAWQWKSKVSAFLLGLLLFLVCFVFKLAWLLILLLQLFCKPLSFSLSPSLSKSLQSCPTLRPHRQQPTRLRQEHWSGVPLPSPSVSLVLAFDFCRN